MVPLQTWFRPLAIRTAQVSATFSEVSPKKEDLDCSFTTGHDCPTVMSRMIDR